MDTVSGVLMIGLILLVSVGVLLFVRPYARSSLFKIDKHILGFIFGVVGTIYAVMIAFSMVVVWEKHDKAEAVVSQEENQIRDLFIMSYWFPIEKRSRVQVNLCAYVDSVVHYEWDYMVKGQAGQKPWKAIADLWTVYGQIEPDKTKENAIYAESLKRLADLSDSRKLRLEASQYKVPTIIEILLWIGATITIVFTCFFRVKNIWSHSLMTVGLAALIGFTMFLIYSLGSPFAGSEAVQSTRFNDDLNWFQHAVDKMKGKESDADLIYAAKNGQSEKVLDLIKAGANVNAKDNHGQTALMNAAGQNYTKIVDLLKSAGAKGNP